MAPASYLSLWWTVLTAGLEPLMYFLPCRSAEKEILMPEKLSRLIVTFQEDVLVVEFADRKIVDHQAISEISQQLTSLLEQRPGLRVLINFSSLDHLSSSALGFLVSFAKRLAETGGQLKLCNIHPQIYEAFVITRLNQVFEIHDSAQAAVAAF